MAEEITETVVNAPLRQQVLDPACRSTTFIETAVERIIERAGNPSDAEAPRKLQENVVRIDTHPVAVQLTKATWVMASKDTILAALAEATSPGAVSAPVYLGDSL